jgi:hypothetical protein
MTYGGVEVKLYAFSAFSVDEGELFFIPVGNM